MNPKQQRQAEILARLVAGGLQTKEAATLMGLSDRQVRRRRAAYEREGMAAVTHGHRGRAAPNRTDPAVVERVLALAGEGGEYRDFNVCRLHELLAGEGIRLGRSTLDRLLKARGLRAARRVSPAKRRRRERSRAAGMMLQIDGSPHDWLEGRGPRLALMGAIDDATNEFVYGHFHPTEDRAGYLRMFRAIATGHGLPMAYYHDRHTILRSPKQPTLEDELAGRTPMSQVQRLMAELGVESIAAHSPQAKGRVERLWRTLQDRLVKEMRLAGVATMDEANAFLPGFIARFNARFALAPADPEAAWVAIEPGMDLDYYFAARETRTVRADHTLSYEGVTYQIARARRDANLAGKKVTVHRTPEGALRVYDDAKRPLSVRSLPARPTPAAPGPSTVPEAEPRPPKRPEPQTPDPDRERRRKGWAYGKRPSFQEDTYPSKSAVIK